MNAKENRLFHSLINQQGIDKEIKKDMIYRVTNGRTITSKELTAKEAKSLIDGLLRVAEAKNSKANKLRRTLISQGYQCGWEIEKTKSWCENHGASGVKKVFNSYSTAELMKLIKVMEELVIYYSKKKKNTATEKETLTLQQMEQLIYTAKNCTNYA